MWFSSMHHRLERIVLAPLFWIAMLSLEVCPVRVLGQAPTSQVPYTISHSVSRATRPTIKAGVESARWPFQITVGQFRIHSVVPIAEFEKQLPSISRLSEDLRETLGIEITTASIDVVVLGDRAAMEEYAKRIVANPPSHRALYIRHRGPGLVLTFHSTEWLHDVRHECTHALLDASQLDLPLWQDEGLAEYFETGGNSPWYHRNHFNAIKSQVRFGQVADLERFELADWSIGLDAKGYRDAWSVIALILHGSVESRHAYQSYLRDVQSKRASGFLSHRLASVVPSWHETYNAFYSSGKPRGWQ